MNFFKIIVLFIIILLNVNNYVYADDVSEEQKKQNIIERAKEVNKQIKKQQAETSTNIASEINNEEEQLPLNDPFAGDAATGGAKTAIVAGSEQEKTEMSLYNFKLVGIISGSYESYVSLVNASGEVITLQIHEELSDGVKLIDMKLSEAIFEKEDGKYMTINFKNQIKETDVY